VPIYALGEDLAFPDPELAHPSGVLAVGGDLRPERLIEAYARGIFPWPDPELPLLWHAPPERFVLPTAELEVPRTLRKVLRRHAFEIRLDTAFGAVMQACSEVPRPGQDGTWISDEMREGYGALHDLGLAHSAEAWRDGELVGGLYGVSLGTMFCGESMFARADDASKVALVTLVRQLQRWGFGHVDCQVHTALFARFGGRLVPRRQFTRLLEAALRQPTRQGAWRLDDDLRQGADQ
jgi:leucyl/phenylalanyl-tRNA--protein transferase